jgi:hypothetical protein
MKKYTSAMAMGMPKMESACSEAAKKAIKEMCNEMLHKEAAKYHEDSNEAHTYEGYVKEAMNCMKEAMHESMEAYKASAKTTAGMK